MTHSENEAKHVGLHQYEQYDCVLIYNGILQ